MQGTFNPALVSRRTLCRGIAGAALLVTSQSFVYAADFWNKKPASDWSGEEVEQLKTKSPWAKKTHSEMTGGFGRGGRGGGGESMDRGGSRGTFGGMSGADSNGIGGGGGGRGGGGGGRGGGGGGRGDEGGGGGGGGAAQGPEVIVRWENARPVLDATKIHLPPELESTYAISVTGLPPQLIAALLASGGRGRGRGPEGGAGREGGGPPPEMPAAPEDPAARQKAMVDRLLHSVTLVAKGKDPQNASLIRQTNNNETLIFGFPKKDLPLTAADKDVLFTMKLGGLSVKAKFEPKEMMYKGELAL